MTTTNVSRFTPNALEILCKRYFAKGDEFPLCEYNQVSSGAQGCGFRHETEEQFFNRISMGNQNYRFMLEALEFLPNSPTLFNMDTKSGGTLSACFKFDIEDTMFDDPSGIMPVANKAAKVLKSGGGVGYVFSKLRPKGSPVLSTHGKALGAEGVAKILHVLASEITQGGKRDAAQMGIIHCEHPDVWDFIHWKDEHPDDLGTFNISVALTDDWMRAALADKTSKQYHLLKEMSESAWRTGDPGVFFIDAAERSNPTPWAGQLTGTNPCGEVPLLNNEPCNLGSINLGKFFTDAFHTFEINSYPIDWGRLEQVTRTATRYLDDVLDRNTFPDSDIDAAARYTRKLGLGVCGFADLLTLMNIQYDTDEAVELGEKIMQFINNHAADESRGLAIEKGAAPCFIAPGEPAGFVRDESMFIRNATRTCIAPTGTIAILMGASSGIEPYFALENTRTMGDGTTFVERPWTMQAVEGAAMIFQPKVANVIGYEWHIKHQAAFQKHTDLAVSKTINMNESVSADDILNAYIMMWQTGCKGGTVYRDKSRFNQVLKTLENKYLNGTTLAPIESSPFGPFEHIIAAKVGQAMDHAVAYKTSSSNRWRDALGDERPSITHKFEVGGMEGYMHVGLYPDGQPAELFLDVARQGSMVDGLTKWMSQVTSLAFQMAHMNGTPFTNITEKWVGRRFEPSGATINKEIPFADSLADYIARWLHAKFATDRVEPLNTSNHGVTCQDCGNTMRYEGNCWHCTVCGYESC